MLTCRRNHERLLGVNTTNSIMEEYTDGCHQNMVLGHQSMVPYPVKLPNKNLSLAGMNLRGKMENFKK